MTAPGAFALADLLSANPGLAIVLGLLVLGSGVFGLLALIMRASGASLRPIVFVAGFFAIVLLPQVLGHLALAVRPAGGDAPVAEPAAPVAPAAATPLALPANGREEDWLPLFARRLPGLQAAPATAWPTGQSLARLRFGSVAEASQGLLTYLGLYSVAPTLDRGGNEVRGTRGLGGGVVHLLREGATLRVATALDDAALDALLQALDPASAAATAAAPAAPTAAAREPLVPALQPPARWLRERVWAQVVAVALLLVAAVAWFFRMGSWAGAVPPQAGALALPAEALRARLMALRGAAAAAPVSVAPRPDGRLAVGWTLTDARWLDAAGLNRRHRVHRLLLRLDEAARTVWVTEQWGLFDAAAGAHGLQVRWQAAVGLVFFERSRSVQAGVVLGADGAPTGALLHRETVDLQALKAPCIDAVTGAGWHWRPVVLDWASVWGRASGD